MQTHEFNSIHSNKVNTDHSQIICSYKFHAMIHSNNVFEFIMGVKVGKFCFLCNQFIKCSTYESQVHEIWSIKRWVCRFSNSFVTMAIVYMYEGRKWTMCIPSQCYFYRDNPIYLSLNVALFDRLLWEQIILPCFLSRS